MADYELTASDAIIRTIDGAMIPNDPNNRDRAEYEKWLKDGNVPDPYIPPPPAPATVLSQDLMAQFTTDDLTKIKAAIDGSIQLWGLWSAMQAQSDPMRVSNERFLQGWGALIQVLGQDRMSAIAKALNVTI